MHTINETSPSDLVPGEAAALLLREARRLHRAARLESLAKSLPVLRRLLESKALYDISLPALYRQRDTVQRKHILRTLAVEAGYPSWETYREALKHMRADELEHFDLISPKAGYPNFWFSAVSEARSYAATHGGRCVRVGGQAVVLLDTGASH